MSTLLYLNREQVIATGVNMEMLMDGVRHAFVAKGEGRAYAPPKGAIYPHGEGFINSMPACLPHASGMKWVSTYPGNALRGLPNVHGLIILNEPLTGQALAVMDATWITAMRTGAVTGLCAQRLTTKERPTAAMLGCGIQARTNLEALMLACPLGELWAYDINAQAVTGYLEEVGCCYPELTTRRAQTPRQAVQEADIIVTAGPIRKPPQPCIDRHWLKSSSLGLPLDYDSYWTADSINGSDCFWVDDLAQFNSLRTHGYFSKLRTPDGDLGQLFSKSLPIRNDATARVLVMSLGLGITDVASAWVVYEQARQQGIGTELAL